MALHNAELGSSLHIIHTFTITDSNPPAVNGSNLAAAPFSAGSYPFSAADVGKVAFSAALGKFYILSAQSAGPTLTWVEITNPHTTPGLAFNTYTGSATLGSGNQIAFIQRSSSTPVNITLPAASGNGGNIIYIKDITTASGSGISSNSGGYVDVLAGGGDLIEGASNLKVIPLEGSVALASDGATNWRILTVKSDMSGVVFTGGGNIVASKDMDVIFATGNSIVSLPAAASAPGKYIRVYKYDGTGSNTQGTPGYVATTVEVNLNNIGDTFNRGQIAQNIMLNGFMKSVSFLSDPADNTWLVIDDDGRGEYFYATNGIANNTVLPSSVRHVFANTSDTAGGDITLFLPQITDCIGKTITVKIAKPLANHNTTTPGKVILYVNPNETTPNVRIEGWSSSPSLDLGGGISTDSNGNGPYVLTGNMDYVTFIAHGATNGNNLQAESNWRVVASAGTRNGHGRTIVGPYTAVTGVGGNILPSDDLILANCASGNVNIYLPDGDQQSGSGRSIRIKKIDASSNQVIINPNTFTLLNRSSSSIALNFLDETIELKLLVDPSVVNGTPHDWSILNHYIPKNPTITKFITGTAATYTVPAGVSWLRVKAVGAGGGGGGNGSGSTAGGFGGDTLFGAATAGGGHPGGPNGSDGAQGGAASLGGFFGLGAMGGGGGCGTDANSGGQGAGGTGGNSALGGGARGSLSNTGFVGGTNTGGGGSGGSNAGERFGGAGGGAGAYIDIIIPSPASSYVYTVGVGGTAGGTGSPGAPGGAGADGVIEIEEYYK